MTFQLKSRKFNKLFNNSQIELQAFIEESYCQKVRLVRSDVNQTVLTPEVGFIGANMKKALSLFQ